MRIAVWYDLPSGGAKRALYYHVRGLVERGHAVESWCSPRVDQTYLPLSRLVTEHVVPFNWNPTPAKTRAADIAALYRYVVEPIKEMDRHCRECAEEINRGGFDLLFANSSLLQAAASIGRHVKIPKVIYLQEPNRRLYEAGLQDGADGWLHEPEMPQLPWVAPPRSEKFWSPKYLKLFLRNTVRVQALRVQAREELLNARAYDAILVNSMFSRESMLRAYGLDAKVCYLGVDTDKFSNLHLARENFVVGLGAIHFYKNIKLVVEALVPCKVSQ